MGTVYVYNVHCALCTVHCMVCCNACGVRWVLFCVGRAPNVPRNDMMVWRMLHAVPAVRCTPSAVRSTCMMVCGVRCAASMTVCGVRCAVWWLLSLVASRLLLLLSITCRRRCQGRCQPDADQEASGAAGQSAKVKEQQVERRAKHVAAKAARDERLLQNGVNAKGGTAGKAGKG